MDVPGASHPPQVCSRCRGALRSTLLQWCSEPHHHSPNPPSFPLSQPSCSSTWVQNHEFSKSLKTTQRGSQGTRGFQRRAALPCISKSCPTDDLSPPRPPPHTHLSQNCFPKKPAQPFSPHPAPPPPSWGRLSIPRVSHLPFPRPLPPP